MKKISTLLLYCIGLCNSFSFAQTPSCELVAGFTITFSAPNTYHFQNTSTGLNSGDSIRWTFGDGTSSNLLHPAHTYYQPGTYHVCLRIQKRNSAGALSTCVKEICHDVIVEVPACNLNAGFSFTRLSPNTFHFQNISAGLTATDSIRWTFGDGTSSNQLNPAHTYSQPGTYNVCLRIQKRNSVGALSTCVKEICHEVIVEAPACNLNAGFSFTRLSPNTFHFQNTSAGLAVTDSIRWTFGDGTSSNQLNPAHTYSQPGTYNVCLRIQKRNSLGVVSTCVREICHSLVVEHTFSCNLVAGFTSGLISLNTYHFQNTSLGLTGADSIRWTFGDGTSSNQYSPNHTYAHPGTYHVCLRIQKRNNLGAVLNCVREVCHTFTSGTTNNCNIQPFPNPATSSININVYLNQPQIIHLYFYNSTNNLVKEKHINGVAGNNLITVAIGDLAPGIYTLKILRGNDVCTSTFVKL
ncbi:MAG: PKD domain-containing protein [Ferruginibacter sp.]